MKYLIWSWRHSQWWKGARAGYTPHLNEAGRYSAEMAGTIVVSSGLPGTNTAVDEQIAGQFSDKDAATIETDLDKWRRQ